MLLNLVDRGGQGQCDKLARPTWNYWWIILILCFTFKLQEKMANFQVN